jgi:peptidoglycan/xylan/chitin deacetylase (PgdA/CDA1 family)
MAIEMASVILPMSSIYSGEIRRTGCNTIALTFDDGPSANVTPQVLDVLSRFDVKATFFVVGECVASHPEVLRRIVREGHKIGLHCDKHTEMISQSVQKLTGRLEACRTEVAKAEGVQFSTALFRPPYGFRSLNTWLAAERLGLKLVLWSVDSTDYMLTDPEKIASKVIKCLEPGKVVLMHDGAYNTATPLALEMILTYIRAEGYAAAAIGKGMDSE